MNQHTYIGQRVQRKNGRDKRWGIVSELRREGEVVKAVVLWDAPWEMSEEQRRHAPMAGNGRSTLAASSLRREGE